MSEWHMCMEMTDGACNSTGMRLRRSFEQNRGSSHQVEAGDGVGGDALRPETNGETTNAPDGEERLDVEPKHMQHHQRSNRHQPPAGQAAQRQ